MSPTTRNANHWRTGLIAVLVFATLTAAVPVRAQPIGLGFSDACPAELEATALGDGSILLEANASTDVMLYRDGTPIAQVNGTGTHFDADVQAGVTYTYHITVLLGGQETPPCDEVTVTAQAAAQADVEANGTAQGNATASGNATANGNATASGHASVNASATLEACPASLRAEARGDGSVLVHVNASSDVDATKVFRTQAGGQPVQIATLTPAGTHTDLDAEAETAYTYSVVIVVDGQTSDVCDSIELTSMPVFGGVGAILATAIAGLAYLVRRRGA